MSDFTKDELQIIHLDVNTMINKYTGILKASPFHLALRDKIESMIENYCEHEHMSPTEAINIPLHCLDCGVKFE